MQKYVYIYLNSKPVSRKSFFGQGIIHHFTGFENARLKVGFLTEKIKYEYKWLFEIVFCLRANISSSCTYVSDIFQEVSIDI